MKKKDKDDFQSKWDSAVSLQVRKLKGHLENAKRVLISTHQLPDGDGLGAQYALYHYLKRARKACRVYNPDPLPLRYRFLDKDGQILLGPGQVELWDTFDLWIIVDTNDPRRVGPLWNELSLRARKIVFLDHHPLLQEEPLNIVIPPQTEWICDSQSGSIGELLYDLFKSLDLSKLNTEMATGIYTSVMTDTNSFRYARTTPKSHIIAAEMIELGVNPEEIYQNIYSSKERSHLNLLGHMLQNIQISQTGKLAWMEVNQEIRKKYRASADDTQSFMNLLLLLRDAEVVCLFREEDDGSIRVSIKSKGTVVVNRIAMDLGGGGHDFAAGMAIPGPLLQAVDQVVKRLNDAIDQHERFGRPLN